MKLKEIDDKKALTSGVLNDVMFFKIAEGGAMGEPGGVTWVRANGESYHLNYCFGNIDVADLMKAFKPLKECCFGIFGMGTVVPNGWQYVNLGMGNHLIVSNQVFGEFKGLTMDIKRASELYGKWYDVAIQITNKEGEKTTMKNNLTEIVFILDKSGSMAGYEADTIGGFNATIEKQKKVDGSCYVSTVLFANRSVVLHDRVDLEKIQPMTDRDYCVGGGTALLDAIGGAIHHIGNVHKYARPEDVPEHTIFIITTDGMENASHEYDSATVKKMIKRQQEKYGWEFIFLAANIDAVETADRIGIRRERAANYRQDPKGMKATYATMSDAISSVRANCSLDEANWREKLDKENEN